MRERYDAPYENESLRKFLAGEQDELPWMQSWLVMLRDLTAQGRRFARVRVVNIPLTDYSRFGVWCSQFTNGAGEDIRYGDGMTLLQNSTSVSNVHETRTALVDLAYRGGRAWHPRRDAIMGKRMPPTAMWTGSGSS